MPKTKKKTKREIIREKNKKKQKTVIDKIIDNLNDVHYICPSKEECAEIKEAFEYLNGLCNDKDAIWDDGDEKYCQTIKNLIKKYPSTLDTGKCFEQSEDVPVKKLKIIASKCGFTYGKKVKIDNINKTIHTVKDYFDVLSANERINNQLQRNNEQNDDIKNTDDVFIEIRKNTISKLKDLKELFTNDTKSVENMILEKKEIKKKIIKKLNDQILTLSGISEKILLAASQLEKKNKDHYVLAFGFGKFDFWGLVCRFLYNEQEYGQFKSSEEVMAVETEITNLKNELIKIRNSLVDEGNNSEDSYKLEFVAKIKEKVEALCHKIINIRSEKYISQIMNDLKQSINTGCKKIANNSLKKNNKNVQIEFEKIDRKISLLSMDISKFKNLKKMKIIHRAKLWVKNNWSTTVKNAATQAKNIAGDLQKYKII